MEAIKILNEIKEQIEKSKEHGIKVELLKTKLSGKLLNTKSQENETNK